MESLSQYFLLFMNGSCKCLQASHFWSTKVFQSLEKRGKVKLEKNHPILILRLRSLKKSSLKNEIGTGVQYSVTEVIKL